MLLNSYFAFATAISYMAQTETLHILFLNNIFRANYPDIRNLGGNLFFQLNFIFEHHVLLIKLLCCY
jgi:hypothetical protein